MVWAKPRSIVRPRRFSSCSRSGSVPVRANTSDDFPWSTCPAVAMTVIGPTGRGAGERSEQRLDDDAVVGRVDGAQVEHRCAVADAGDHGAGVGAQRCSSVALAAPRRTRAG